MEKRALISVYDKKGIVEFAKTLEKLGWEILSTGGTKRHLEEAGLAVTDVQEVTQFPEILDGRVKTLAPQIFAGLLYRRDDPNHVETMKKLGLKPIDMVVNTLYPFVETVKNPDSTEADIIEKIDIGGPSMIRACAKNFKDTIIVTRQCDYERVAKALEEDKLDYAMRKDLARIAFETTAAYDIAIAHYFQSFTDQKFPQELFLHMTRGYDLRYGENPHQDAAYYQEDRVKGTLNDATVLQGKALSFNNLNDATMACESIKHFTERPTVIGLKHANACAIASADNLYDAWLKCFAADSMSIFGGIVVFNGTVDEKTAKKLTEIFLEVVIAPEFTEGAKKAFKKKKNLRVLEIPSLMYIDKEDYDMKRVLGGMLVQERDGELIKEWNVVTDREPTEKEKKDLLFAYKCCKAIKSNGIVLVKDEVTTGIGLGEVNRIWAAEEAVERSGENVKGAVCASDAFFPFDDCMTLFAKAGVTAVIQPGGSIRDKDSEKVANENDIAMVYTAMRHFKH